MDNEIITVGLGILASRAVEFLPGVKVWWAALDANVKLALRGGSAVVFAIIYVAITQGRAGLHNPEVLGDIGRACITFIIGAEGAYQLTAFQLPRKRS